VSAGEAIPSPHVSFSSITTYLRCSRQHEHRYLLKTPPSHRSVSLAFGSAVHRALALFYARRMRGLIEPIPQELADEFSDAWTQELDGDVPVLFDEGDSPGSLRDKGIAMLRVFHKDAPRPRKVIAVEEPFSVDLRDPESGEVLPDLLGYVDAIVEDNSGRCRILEHKTAARRFSEDKLRFDLQPTAYHLAAKHMGLGDAAVTFQVLLKQREPALELYDLSRTHQDHRDLIEVIAGVTRAVEAGAFYAVRDWWCRGCPYAGPCLVG